uniref:FLYWCH-type domain-containing protein n=1 Tax=Steinernema glaseri TaxID=37863 RepID=A0A1I7Y8S7_9BILA
MNPVDEPSCSQTEPDLVQFQSFSSKRNRTSVEKFGTGVYMRGGFSYRLDKMLKREAGMGSYRCTDVKCHGRAKIHPESGMGKVVSGHDHPPSDAEAQVRLAKDAIEVAARTTAAEGGTEVVKAAVEAIRSTFSKDVLAKTSSSEVFERNFQRSLKRRNPDLERDRKKRVLPEREENPELVQFESYSSKKNRTSLEKFGTGIFMHAGYSYRLDKMLKKMEGCGSFRCVDTRCRGRARINIVTGMGHVVLDHYHAPTPEAAQVRLARDVLEAAARTAQVDRDPAAARQTVEAIRSSLTEDALEYTSSQAVLTRTFHRSRKRLMQLSEDGKEVEESEDENTGCGTLGDILKKMAEGEVHRVQDYLKEETTDFMN